MNPPAQVDAAELVRADGRGDELREDDKVYGDIPRQHSVCVWDKALAPCLVWVNILKIGRWQPHDQHHW